MRTTDSSIAGHLKRVRSLSKYQRPANSGRWYHRWPQARIGTATLKVDVRISAWPSVSPLATSRVAVRNPHIASRQCFPRSLVYSTSHSAALRVSALQMEDQQRNHQKQNSSAFTKNDKQTYLANLVRCALQNCCSTTYQRPKYRWPENVYQRRNMLSRIGFMIDELRENVQCERVGQQTTKSKSKRRCLTCVDSY